MSRPALIARRSARPTGCAAIRSATPLPVIWSTTASGGLVAAVATLKPAAPPIGVIPLEISVAVRWLGLFEPVRSQAKVKRGVWVRHGRKIINFEDYKTIPDWIVARGR